MKTCNNCGCENVLAAEKCTQCRMSGNFTFLGMPGEAAQIPEAKIHCKNCGCQNPGGGTKCIDCKFPIRTSESKKIKKINTSVEQDVGLGKPDNSV